MRKIVIAILCAVILLVSIAAAQVALPPKAVQATDLSIASSQANAFGLKADKNQCMCSADTLAKIAQIKKMLAELEQSCSAGPQVPVEPVQPTQVYNGNCVDKCMAEEGKPYCEKSCVEGREGPRDDVCLAGCNIDMKQKCWNTCNMPAEQEQGTSCLDTCMAKNYDKAGCLGTCSQEDINNDGPCYKACQQKAEIASQMCQKECVGQPTGDELKDCTNPCENKYSECRDNCAVIAGCENNGCYPGAENYGAKMKILSDCTINQCMPALQQCSLSCKDQYAPKPTIVQKVVNVFKYAQFRNAKWICHDGTESVEGGDSSCKPSELWSTYAKEACDGKCSTETNKCGVNTFMVYNEC